MPVGERVERTCERCAQHFTVLASHLRLGKTNGRFCSTACYRNQPAPVPAGSAQCQACRVVFTAPDWRRRRFCSACWANKAAYAHRKPRRDSGRLSSRDQRIVDLWQTHISAGQIVAQLATEWPKLTTKAVYHVIYRSAHDGAVQGLRRPAAG